MGYFADFFDVIGIGAVLVLLYLAVKASGSSNHKQ